MATELYRALALSADDFEGNVPVPVDELVHGLQTEVGGKREILYQCFQLARAHARQEGVPLLALLAAGLVVRDPALDRVGDALGGQPQLQARAECDLAAFEDAAQVGDVGGDRVLAHLDRGAREAHAAPAAPAAGGGGRVSPRGSGRGAAAGGGVGGVGGGWGGRGGGGPAGGPPAPRPVKL